MPRIADALRQQVIERAQHRCEYCHALQVIVVSLEVDHIVPESAGGKTTLDNLSLACRHCNGYKQHYQTGTDPDTNQVVPLFNPRTDRWREHFAWVAKGIQLIGLTPTGRATIERLRMNREPILLSRQVWIENGWHPPPEDSADTQ